MLLFLASFGLLTGGQARLPIMRRGGGHRKPSSQKWPNRFASLPEGEFRSKKNLAFYNGFLPTKLEILELNV